MVNFAPPANVEGAPRVPLPFGLLSVLTPRPEGDGKWQNGARWEALTCDPASGIGEPDCEPGAGGETQATGLPKAFPSDSNLIDDATAFTVYGSFECSPVGWSPEQAEERARLHLLAREEARVEQALWTGDLGNTPNLTPATDITDGTAASPVLALALLEKWIAEEYGSVGVIHANRSAASTLVSNGLIRVEGSRLVTLLGTPVVAGAGYPGSDPDGDAFVYGYPWLRATPALFGYRSDVFTGSNREGDNFDRSQNNMRAVAERTYLIGFDQCAGVATVRMAVTCC